MARPLCGADRVRVASNFYTTARNAHGYSLLDAMLRSGAAFLARMIKVSLIKLIDSSDRPAPHLPGQTMPLQSFIHPVEGIDWYCQQQRDGRRWSWCPPARATALRSIR